MIIIYAALEFVFLTIVFEGAKLKRNRAWKDLSAAVLLLLIALAYGVDFSYELNMLPDPADLFRLALPIGKALQNFAGITTL